jgi:hypothetical protein
MDKHILSTFNLNKAKPFSIIKPFNGSLTFHVRSSLAASEKNILDDFEEWHLPKKEKPKKALIPLSASEYRNLSLLCTFAKAKKDLA